MAQSSSNVVLNFILIYNPAKELNFHMTIENYFFLVFLV